MKDELQELQGTHGFYIKIIIMLNGTAYKEQIIKISMMMMCCDREYAKCQINELIKVGLFVEVEKVVVLADYFHSKYDIQAITTATYNPKTKDAIRCLYNAELLITTIIPQTAESFYHAEPHYPNQVLRIEDLEGINLGNYIQVLGNNLVDKLYSWCFHEEYNIQCSKEFNIDYNMDKEDLLKSDSYNFYTLADRYPIIVNDVYSQRDMDIQLAAYYCITDETVFKELEDAIDFLHETFYLYFPEQYHYFVITLICANETLFNKFISFKYDNVYTSIGIKNIELDQYTK
ncbi:hypothetical protein [[Clostridium] fimetarium]|uniref:Uncharacterized protein n=1 Tax=[Clostridium] fimetarium TaxID=99656 RepID=A0A1I0QVJ9_9FIRM|nr:hypothetical protein [[Clostridium] fimetarium]SEW31715.1 hypothetical protein SAMN05421659_109175 [[Clostridium] fimetarium]